jgi:hypothetical protein
MARIKSSLVVAFFAFPAVIAGVLAAPGMVGTAEGCSGGPAVLSPGWQEVYWADDLAAPTDAVVVIPGMVKELDDQQALAAFDVSVTDASGAEVPGTLSIESLGMASEELKNVVVVWKPDAPLAAGASYDVSWTIAEGATTGSWVTSSGQGVLVTNGALGVAPAPSGQATFERTRKLVGEVVSCESTSSAGCPTTTLSFPSTEIEPAALALEWSYPATTTSVYQITRVEPVAGKGVLDGPAPVILNATPYTEDPVVGLAFSDEVDEYCVRLVTRDLRDGSETTSADICAPASDVSPASPSLLSSYLQSCAAPPNDALTGEWCAVHPGSELCDPLFHPGDGTAADPEGGDVKGCSCSLPARRDPRALGLLALGLLALVWRRRI